MATKDKPERPLRWLCPVCRSVMKRVSETPEVWYCIKCGAKKAGQS
ncbi:Uncharacterised protein [uncultured archaeon]|nr:Uncharacterised protein [uncultured archaeon]